MGLDEMKMHNWMPCRPSKCSFDEVRKKKLGTSKIERNETECALLLQLPRVNNLVYIIVVEK